MAIVEGEDPEIEVRLPGTMLESDDLYLQVTYKALAVYRYQAYNEVQRILSPPEEDAGQRLHLTKMDIEMIGQKLSLKDIYRRVFELYLDQAE